MKPGSFLLYAVLRLGLFAVLIVLLLLLGFEPWIAAVVAAILALCISIIFFGKPRSEVAKGLAERPSRRKDDSDSQVEDSITDADPDAAR